MSAPSGKVLARRESDEVCLLVVGHVTCHHAPAMRQFAEQAHASGARDLLVNLCDCTYCDSTFLGTLLQLQRLFLTGNHTTLRLVAPSPQFRQLLAQIGADRLFEIAEQLPPTDIQTTWQQLSSDLDRAAMARFKRNIVEAHQELARAGGALAERFGPLAEAASLELDSNEEPTA